MKTLTFISIFAAQFWAIEHLGNLPLNSVARLVLMSLAIIIFTSIWLLSLVYLMRSTHRTYSTYHDRENIVTPARRPNPYLND